MFCRNFLFWNIVYFTCDLLNFGELRQNSFAQLLHSTASVFCMSDKSGSTCRKASIPNGTIIK